jgi:DnaJ-domain-containing protein 1
MPKKSTIRKHWEAGNDFCKLITGKSLVHVLYKAVDLFGEDIIKKFSNSAGVQFNPDDPYYVLGIHEDAQDIIVKAAYRALAREYHPDTGTKPDPTRFQKVTEAYQAILKARRCAKENAAPGAS